jgi:hypothetical protein
MNGQKVKLYFDPAAPTVSATIVATTHHAGFTPGDIVCQAALMGDLPHYTRAAMGWSDYPTPDQKNFPSTRKPLSAVRREVRALSPQGRIKSTFSEERDGRGGVSRVERSSAPAKTVEAPRRNATPRTAPARIQEPVIDEVEEIEIISSFRAPAIEIEEQI